MEHFEDIYSYREGLKDSIPIALGYLGVSFTFGMIAVSNGLDIIEALVMSMTNLTSAGQFAGLNVIVAMGTYVEIVLSQLVINIRYSLMSVSLSQKFDKGMNFFKRLFVAFGMTDEIFAVASAKKHKVGFKYMAGLITLPYIGWALGTFLGAFAGDLLPISISNALGIAIYGMFIAIIIPPAKHLKGVRAVIMTSILLSFIFSFTPFLKEIGEGFAIIICAVISCVIGAVFFPVKEEENEV